MAERSYKDAELTRKGVGWVLITKTGDKINLSAVEGANPGQHVGKKKWWRVQDGVARLVTPTKRDDIKIVSGDAGRGKKK